MIGIRKALDCQARIELMRSNKMLITESVKNFYQLIDMHVKKRPYKKLNLH
jgi:hypothetical protein